MESVLNDACGIAPRVSHYAIDRLIGAGAMGKVYLARDEQLRRHVAIKILIDAGLDATERVLLAEARCLSRAVHPCVATVFDFVIDDARECIVMEFVPGATLKEVLMAGPLAADDVLRLGIQMARGVAAAHASGVLHRDLKPQNIKVTPSGQVKILDFGVAAMLTPRRLIDTASRTSSVGYAAGTVCYMSPEQLRGEVLDERSDVFSLGALLYEMSTGRPAFPQQSLARLVDAIQHGQPVPLLESNPFAPRGLDRVIAKALEKDRERRYRGAGALASELRSLRAGSPAGAAVGLGAERGAGDAPL
jgi:serine/threonine protein kinase